MISVRNIILTIKRFFQKNEPSSPEESTLYIALISLLIIGSITDISALLFLDNWIIPFKLLIIHVIFVTIFIGLKKRVEVRLLQFSTIIASFFGLASFWFETKGILGAVSFYFLVVIILGNTLLPVKHHKYALAFALSIIAVLFMMEYNFPHLLQNPYPNELFEKKFSIILLIMGTILSGTITSYFKSSYIQHHEELEQKNKELSKSNQELDNLIYSISHDLRAPIVSLMGLVNLHKTITENEEAMQYIELEERSLDKLDKFIQDLLSYSRVNRMEAQAEEVDLKALLTDIIEQIAFYHQSKQNCQNQPQQKSVDIRLECELTRPFFSDKTKLQIVLQNLISNAVHYADFSKENPFCKVKVSQSPTQTIIEVADNGVGIDARHNAKIFDMFYRGNTNSKGSGLGLYIVKEATEKMKGKIHFHSVLKEGSTFVLELP